MRFLRLAFFVIGSVGILGISLPARADSYIYTPLPGVPFGINNSGQIVGVGGDEVFLRNPDGAVQWFNMQPASAGSGYLGGWPVIGGIAINDLGQLAWTDGADHGFVRDPDGTIHPFAVPKGTSITGLNDSGQVAGTSFSMDTCPEYLCGVVGDMNGNFITFNIQFETFVYGMNNLGQVVGLSHNDETGFVRNPDGTVVQTIGGFPQLGAVYGINDAGEIVGGVAPDGLVSSSIIHGVVGGGLFDYPGAVQTLLTGINDSGEFIGQHDGVGFLATPVPEPSSLLLLVTILVFLSVIAVRKHNVK
jgi:hypothetical protein